MSIPKSDSIKIFSDAIVCEESKLRGDVTIGSNTVIHPKATILAEAGPIVISERCLVEEQVIIIHRLPLDAPKPNENDPPPVLKIGPDNVFEVGAVCELSESMGPRNVIESKAFVGPKVAISSGCRIGAGCRITRPQTLHENTIFFGKNCTKREGLEKPPLQVRQIDFLARALPNYHHFRRPNRKH